MLYVRLGNFPSHYLVLVIIYQDSRPYTLIRMKDEGGRELDEPRVDPLIEDIGCLDARDGDIVVEGGSMAG